MYHHEITLDREELRSWDLWTKLSLYFSEKKIRGLKKGFPTQKLKKSINMTIFDIFGPLTNQNREEFEFHFCHHFKKRNGHQFVEQNCTHHKSNQIIPSPQSPTEGFFHWHSVTFIPLTKKEDTSEKIQTLFERKNPISYVGSESRIQGI